MDRYWVAIILCRNEETGRIMSSFLAFWAKNRFYALQAVRNMLPENPEYLDASGNLRPFDLIELKTIKEAEHEFYQAAFFESFQTTFGVESGAIKRQRFL
jgi:hypothetical protein